jgi:hypothetical protein
MKKPNTKKRVMDQKLNNLKFKYVIPKEAPDLHVNGVFGGVTPRNEIHMHFYSERSPIPNSITYTRKNDKSEFVESAMDIGGDVVRVIQSSIVMDKTSASNLYYWLKELLKNMDQKDEE